MAETDLGRLYQDIVLRHSRSPHNQHCLPAPDARAEGHNPLCGDRITLYLQLDDGTIREAAFEAVGCAIALASASMLTDAVTGSRRDQALALAAAVQARLSGDDTGGDLGEIEALSGVRAYPMRVRCATLPWRTLEAALRGAHRTVSTETDGR
ncbi:MAG: SUF system NifU family Fe-S cluster assembly protein [Gammaproteobacteria bacterium]|nr:SUF system NifU family Fe-S cluster assembly protein [Gammaproteobacteria bacterium]